MSGNRISEPIRIGVVAEEPIRLAGLTSIFDQPAREAHARLLPVPGSMRDLLAKPSLKFLVVQIHSAADGVKILDSIRRSRPDLRLIVIGPEGNDDLVLKSIVAGARAYLGLSDGPDIVRQAVEVVTQGSIWAPRRLLSKLIDQLLDTPEACPASRIPHLTTRERQVLDLILKAKSNREIASQLGIEERTVRAHLGRLMRKAGVDNRIKLSMSVLVNAQSHASTGRRA